jgi:hypothetical protein
MSTSSDGLHPNGWTFERMLQATARFLRQHTEGHTVTDPYKQADGEFFDEVIARKPLRGAVSD